MTAFFDVVWLLSLRCAFFKVAPLRCAIAYGSKELCFGNATQPLSLSSLTLASGTDWANLCRA